MRIAGLAGTFVYRALVVLVLIAVEQHVALGARALAIMALSNPRVQRQTPPNIQKSFVDFVIDGGDVEREARFTEGGIKMVNGQEIRVVEDREARVMLYITDKGITSVHIPAPEGTCEDEDLEDSGIRTVQAKESR